MCKFLHQREKKTTPFFCGMGRGEGLLMLFEGEIGCKSIDWIGEHPRRKS